MADRGSNSAKSAAERARKYRLNRKRKLESNPILQEKIRQK